MTLEGLVTCYNKGCGQKFNILENNGEKCQYHPGIPIFHDAYKGWSCCNKKSTDFTEFLNFKGCTKGKHSNEKPAEIEKPKVTDEELEEKIKKQEERKSVINKLQRPSFETSCIMLEPFINPSFKKQIDAMDLTKKLQESRISGSIDIGTSCKNGGCKSSYVGISMDESSCVYHPGVPIFHEGYKFWSCCQKKTSDFQAFLEQAGCETGKHKWIGDNNVNNISCRWDWHQTAGNIVVAVYAKNYDYKKSFVKLNPIRLIVKIVFPLENDAEFNIDLELRGIVNVEKASAKMYGTKIEITLPKQEAGHWLKLDALKEPPAGSPKSFVNDKTMDENIQTAEDNESDVDLDDLEIIQGAKISELAQKQN